MDDIELHARIEQLVAEEHELWESEAAGGVTEGDRQRLDSIKVTLDQCWDLCGSAVPCVPLGWILTWQGFAAKRQSSTTSSSRR